MKFTIALLTLLALGTYAIPAAEADAEAEAEALAEPNAEPNPAPMPQVTTGSVPPNRASATSTIAAFATLTASCPAKQNCKAKKDGIIYGCPSINCPIMGTFKVGQKLPLTCYTNGQNLFDDYHIPKPPNSAWNGYWDRLTSGYYVWEAQVDTTCAFKLPFCKTCG